MDIMRYGGSPWMYLKLAPVAKDVHFDNERMYILLTDERELSVPLKWFPILYRNKSRSNKFIPTCNGHYCISTFLGHGFL